MGKLIEDLDTNELNHWVAKARGWVQVSEFYWKDSNGITVLDGVRNETSTNPAQWAELIEEFKIEINWEEHTGMWACCEWKVNWSRPMRGNKLSTAIRRAVIASVYGKEVPGE